MYFYFYFHYMGAKKSMVLYFYCIYIYLFFGLQEVPIWECHKLQTIVYCTIFYYIVSACVEELNIAHIIIFTTIRFVEQ